MKWMLATPTLLLLAACGGSTTGTISGISPTADAAPTAAEQLVRSAAGNTVEDIAPTTTNTTTQTSSPNTTTSTSPTPTTTTTTTSSPTTTTTSSPTTTSGGSDDPVQDAGPTTTSASTSPGDMGVQDADFGRMLNNLRINYGAGSVAYDSRLDAAAEGHAQDMIDNEYFSHTGLNGSSVKDRIDAQGYNARAWGENIAAGQQSEQAALDGWENSPGHLKMMTSNNLEDFGFGFANDGRDTRWVLVMGTEN